MYRFAATGVEKVGEEVRVRALLSLPFGTPVDSLDAFLNPDRRHLPDTRTFASEMLDQIPEGARVAPASRTGELLYAPARYLTDVEHSKVGLGYEPVGLDARGALLQWAAEEFPLFLVGLHPPNPAVESLLERYQFTPEGYLFRVEPRQSISEPVASDAEDPIPITGEWSGFIRPQGFTVDFSILEAPDGTFGGEAVLNQTSARALKGPFTRISLIGESVLGRVTYDEKVNIHIDSSQAGNRLEGTWQVFEAPSLNGSFVVWKR
jgi:hypothetical protein